MFAIHLSSKQGNTYLFFLSSVVKKNSRFLHPNLNKATGVDQTKPRIKRLTLTFSMTLQFLFILFLKH